MAPTGLYGRLKSFYTGHKEPEVPSISATTAVALLIGYTLIYVLPFYVLKATRPSPTLSRDAPSAIRGRIRSVTVSCVICSISTFVLLTRIDHGTPIDSLHLMGYFPVGFDEVCKTLALTAIFFIGPLFEKGYVEGGWRDWIRLRGLDYYFNGWIGYRNIIAGPITEEVLFRSAAIPLFLMAHISPTKTVFLTPVIFGLAHVHHFYEFRITHPETPIVSAFLRSLLQFTYTTLFGGYVTFIYLRTSSLAAVIAAHMFCNWMGFPRFWGMIGQGESVMGPDVGGKKEDDGDASSEEKGSMVNTIIYYGLLVAGAVAWYKLLWKFTESESALVTF